MNPETSEEHTNNTEGSRTVAVLQHILTCYAVPRSSVSLRDSRTSRPSHTTRSEQHTPDPSETDAVFEDRKSGVVFSSGVYKASGERITEQEFHKESKLAPTLRLVIPSSATAVAEDACPTFSLTLATPISPSSAIHPPSPKISFSDKTYYALAERAPPSARVPYLPHHCLHTLRPFLRPTKCKSCKPQLIACHAWWCTQRAAQASTLCAPPVPPPYCTQMARSVYSALGIPLGKFDPSSSGVDLDVVDSIIFIRRAGVRDGSGSNSNSNSNSNGSKQKPVRMPSSSRLRVLFRRARHILHRAHQ